MRQIGKQAKDAAVAEVLALMNRGGEVSRMVKRKAG